MQHPLFSNKKNLYIYIFIWLIIAVFHILVLVFNQGLPWNWSILDGLLFNIIYALFGCTLWYPCRYISLDKLSLLKIVENHFLAALFASLLWVGLSQAIPTDIFSTNQDYLLFMQKSMIWRGVIGVLYYFLIIAFYYLFIYYSNFKKQVVKEAELKNLIQEAELRSLKFQINPHFIFNSLNSINSLTLTNPRKAGEMTIKLGDYLRYTLSKNDQQKSLLKEELKSAKLYLEIEKVRFGHKIEFSENVESSCLERMVPSMILQPLFENAIKHGVYESLNPVLINFTCDENGAFIKISLQNNFDPGAVPRKGEGIGLKNIKRRLEMLYNHKNLLDIEKTDNSFRVNLFIPV